MTDLARRFQAALRHPAYRCQRLRRIDGVLHLAVIHRAPDHPDGVEVVSAPANDPEIAAVCRADYARARRHPRPRRIP